MFRVPSLVSAATISRVAGDTIIAYRASLPEPYAQHAIAHEIGHWALERCGVDDSEEGSDYIAAALLMPRAAFVQRVREVGVEPLQLALSFGVTETAAILRYGEVMGAPLALIAPATVRVRGPESWVWPDEPTLRKAAVTGLPGLAKVRLQGKRVALVG